MANDDYVVFEDSSGNLVSNDPRWHAKNRLKQDGVDVDALQARIAELEAQIKPTTASDLQSEAEQADDDDDTDEDGDPTADSPYADIKGKALAELAKERGISLKHEDGTSLKANEVREALAAQDANKE